MFKKYSRSQLKPEVRGDFCFVVCEVEERVGDGKYYETFIETNNHFDEIISRLSRRQNFSLKRGYENVDSECVGGISYDINRLNAGQLLECKHVRSKSSVLEDIDEILLSDGVLGG